MEEGLRLSHQLLMEGDNKVAAGGDHVHRRHARLCSERARCCNRRTLVFLPFAESLRALSEGRMTNNNPLLPEWPRGLGPRGATRLLRDEGNEALGAGHVVECRFYLCR